MQPAIDYLNVEYLLVKVYEFLVSFHGVVSGAPAGFSASLTGIIVMGTVLSLVLLILVVYAEIRLLQTEHHGFHAIEAQAHKQHDDEVESTGVNDRFERIVELASSANHGEWRRAILEADIMLSDALNERGYSGAGVGEQLKVANPLQLTTLDLAWKAHKIRNDIAHGGESYALSERDVHSTIDYYKRVFEELGVI